ncbi:hypothetical protein [Nocardia sp. XZ_19_385]|uniref:hypothetical protein n=1 Tax=Nocardia sp. XZ_19_385 TaxID=2769488 RepID=UPI00188E4155|nr:hypothetical protein [Nocardia sp. XZ_19_385]
MTLGRQLVSARSRNRLVAAVAVALAGAVAWLLRSRRPQPPAVAPEPPRIGYSRNGSPQPVSVDGRGEA